MRRFPKTEVRAHLRRAREAAHAGDRGRALEDAACCAFTSIPGIFPPFRNIIDFADGGEIDLFFPNKGVERGLWFLPTSLLVECKNWQGRVGGEEIRVFIDRLRERACRVGVLIAANGITGEPESLDSARRHIARALEDEIHVLVLTLDELNQIASSAELVRLLLDKWTKLKSFLSSV